MSFLTYPFKAYVRWRHSHGFGVHSPFAYNLVDMAVRPGIYGYYGYDEIDRVTLGAGYKGYPESRHDARLLLRFLVQLHTRRLLLPPGLPAMCAAADATGTERIIYSPHRLPPPQKDDLIIVTPGQITTGELDSRLKAGCAIFAISLPQDEIEALYTACRRGLCLRGKRINVVIPREDMAFVAYTMKF